MIVARAVKLNCDGSKDNPGEGEKGEVDHKGQNELKYPVPGLNPKFLKKEADIVTSNNAGPL
jgi:hypothetical protein